MDIKFANRVDAIAPSTAMVLMDRARAMRSEGRELINLTGGEPDFDTPRAAARAGIAAIEQGLTHYTEAQGIRDLREAIAQKLLRENGLNFGAEEVIVTPGAKYAIFMALMVLVEEGDEVIIPTPSWVSYAAMVSMAGGTPVMVELSEEDDYALNPRLLEAHVSKRTKAIIINSPNNPTGRVLTEAEAEGIAGLALKYNLVVIADEVYEKLVFDGRRHLSLGADSRIADRVITVNGFSKFAAMTGWRVGYLAAPQAFIRPCMKLYQHSATCISEFSQRAALAALGCAKESAEMTASYDKRRRFWTERFAGLSGVRIKPAEGGFYAWMRIDYKHMSSEALCEYILDKTAVLLVPGSAYGTDKPYLRVSLAMPFEELEKGADRLRTLFTE